jgi:hypothetical protein
MPSKETRLRSEDRRIVYRETLLYRQELAKAQADLKKVALNRTMEKCKVLSEREIASEFAEYERELNEEQELDY